MTAWLAKWRWITLEWLSGRLPPRWHERVCPFCSGWNAYARRWDGTP